MFIKVVWKVVPCFEPVILLYNYIIETVISAVYLNEIKEPTMSSILHLIKQSFERLDLTSGEKKDLKARILSEVDTMHKLNVLRSKVFDLIKDESANAETIKLVNWIEDINKLLLPKKDGKSSAETRCYFSPGDDCENAIIQTLRSATKSVKICVFTISENEITDEIIRTHQKGVNVHVVTDNDKINDRGSDIRRIAEAGIIVKIDQSSSHMHHKFCIVDKRVLITGSYNWTKSAADRNQENLLITEDSKVVRSYQREFEKLWDLFPVF